MKMATREAKRLTGRELHALFDEWFLTDSRRQTQLRAQSQVTIATAVALTIEAAAMSY